MSDVRRYEPFGRDGLSSIMHEDDTGDYVRHDDYEAKRRGWIEQHSRDSAELRRICEERDQLRAELEAIRGQQPDAVSVPRELLRRLLDSNNRNTFCAGTYLQAHDELSAILSTKNAEEWE